MRDLQEALQPRPGGPLTPADCSPPGAADRVAFFLRHGFCILPHAVGPEKLRRLQAAWEPASARARRQWERAKAGGTGVRGQNFASPPAGGPAVHRTFYDIDDFLEQDDQFFELIALPDVVQLVEQVCGMGRLVVQEDAVTAAGNFFPVSDKSPYHGVAQCSGFQARVVPPDGNEHGYISCE
eukprot:SAG22_NODE_142_length_17922_cov_10.990406_3_plen_182_part_00